MADSDLVRQVRELERERDIFRGRAVGDRDSWYRELLERRHLLYKKLERELVFGVCEHDGIHQPSYLNGVADVLNEVHFLCYGDDKDGDNDERF